MLREKVGDAYREGLFVKEQVRVCLPDSLSFACLRRQSRDSTREFSQNPRTLKEPASVPKP